MGPCLIQAAYIDSDRLKAVETRSAIVENYLFLLQRQQPSSTSDPQEYHSDRLDPEEQSLSLIKVWN